MAFAIAYYTTNTNSVKTVTSAINGGHDRICVCSLGQLRKRPTAPDQQKSYLPFFHSDAKIPSSCEEGSDISALTSAVGMFLIELLLVVVHTPVGNTHSFSYIAVSVVVAVTQRKAYVSVGV